MAKMPMPPSRGGKRTGRPKAMPKVMPKAMPKGMPSPNARAMERANPNARFKRAAGAPVSGTPLKRAAATPVAPRKHMPARPKAGGGIDLPKFASEVSGNYAKGVARVGNEVNKAIAGVRGLAGSNAGISNAMKTGADKNNPLHRILQR